MDTEKYDRQIRLFGLETQQALSRMTVQVVGGDSLVSAEIVKDIVLLGVSKLVAAEGPLAAAERMVAGRLCDINEHIVVEASEHAVPCDFLFAVDVPPPPACRCYFICSRCLTVQKDTSAHACQEACYEPGSTARHAAECLAGAFAVQEFIKFVQGKKHAESYRVEL